VICFVGTSHAPRTLAAAAVVNGFAITPDPREASLVFISEDTPTNKDGERDVSGIRALVHKTVAETKAPIVLTSQVPPGFTRSLGLPIFCMAETLRIKDAMARALKPEQFIIGVPDAKQYALPLELVDYCFAHNAARVLVMSYEEAEFSKIAINMFLAAQVDTTNKLAAAASKVGASWEPIADALRADKRIGPHAYLTPGRWQDSSHLLRDWRTLEEICST
jgi:UDPglucose 6-dehydrogenase